MDLLSFDHDSKNQIIERCFYIITELTEECYNSYCDISSLHHKKERVEHVESIACRFYNGIQDFGGPGVSHQEHAINFIQLASIFGFIPFNLINWVHVSPKSSDTDRAINYFYKKTLHGVCSNIV